MAALGALAAFPTVVFAHIVAPGETLSQIADNAGIDTYVRVGRSFAALGASDIVAASPLMEKMLKAGRLGRKVGKGFYDYTKK